MRVQTSTVIAATPERVWSVLVAWEEQPRWMKDAGAVRVLGDRREGVGVRLAVPTRVLGVRLFTDLLEVTAWEPAVRIVIAHRRFVRGEGTWRLEPAAGGTRFTWSEDVAVPVPHLGDLALVAYRPMLRRVMRRSLEGLRIAVESEDGPR